MEDALICAHCGERIGVYEPLVLVEDGHARSSSRAAEPQLGARGDGCYHAACWQELHRGHAPGV